jgi:hypothetical protein
MWSVIVLSKQGRELAKYTFQTYPDARNAARYARETHKEMCRDVTVRLKRED